jgi:hypothetical protein
MKRALAIAVALLALAALAWWALRGPSPEQILASIEVPESPPLTPEQALAQFHVSDRPKSCQSCSNCCE